MVIKIISPTKAYISGSRASKSSSGLCADHMEADVVISGNNVTVTFCHAEQSTSVHKFNITAINSSEFTAHQKVTVTEKGTVVRALDYTVRFEKVTADYSADILGTWEGQVTSEQDTYGDGQKHRWEFKADGTTFNSTFEMKKVE